MAAQQFAESDYLFISEELIADRLRCMQAQIRSGCTTQVLLHAITIANMLSPEYPHARAVREIVCEALTLFVGGHPLLASKRLHAAIAYFPGDKTRPLPGNVSRARSRVANA